MNDNIPAQSTHEQFLRERELYARMAATPEQRTMAARMFTISERLSRRNRTPMPITIEDDLGPIEIRVKTPSMRVINEALAIQRKMAAGFQDETLEDLEELEDRLCHILGEDICADPELGYEYWKRGDYSPELPFEVLAKACQLYSKDMSDGDWFLGDAERKTAGRAVHKDGQTTP